MINSHPVRMTARRTRSIARSVPIVVGALLLGVVGHQAMAYWDSSSASLVRAPRDHKGERDEASGAVPEGTTVFDDVPAVANLNPDLLAALRRAAADAADAGITFYVNSGWRSREYQEQLLRRAVAKYGSESEAARWVATPDTSAHVLGDAVDIGRAEATKWLSRHGARYGLCQIYRNEPWHYELRPEAVDHGCPPMYDDPSKDPRMRGTNQRS